MKFISKSCQGCILSIQTENFYIYQKSYIYTKQTRISRENREYNTIYTYISTYLICYVCVCMCTRQQSNKRKKTNNRI